MKVKIQKEVLSDRSEVFNVVILGHEQTYIIPAVTVVDAQALRDGIIDLVNKHSCQVAKHAFDSVA